MKKKLIVFFLILYSFTSFAADKNTNKNIILPYYINNTTVPLDVPYGNEFNDMATKFKKETGVSVYLNIIGAPKGSTKDDIKSLINSQKTKIYNIISKDPTNKEFIIFVFDLFSYNGSVSTNSSDPSLQKEIIEKIVSEYVISLFDYILFRLDPQTGIVVEAIKKENITNQTYSDYLLKSTYGMMGTSFLYGLSSVKGINLGFKKEQVNLIKFTPQIRQKIATFYQEQADEQEKLRLASEAEQRIRLAKQAEDEQRLKEGSTNITIKFTKEQEAENKRIQEEKQRKDAELAKETKALEEAMKWNWGLAGSTNYTYNISKYSSVDNTTVDPITGLVYEVQESKENGTGQLSMKPFFKSKENGELGASLSYIKYDDFIAQENSYSKMKFDYVKGKFLGDTYTIDAIVGDLSLSDNSYLILNKNYRGIYAGAQYYLNYNPDKFTYAVKVKNGEIKDKSVKSFRLSGIFASKDNSIGEKTDQPQTSGLLFETFMKIPLTEDEKEKDKKEDFYHLGYVYGSAELNNKTTVAQDILISGTKYLFDSNPLYFRIDYSTSLNEQKDTAGAKTQNEGTRLDLRASYKTNIFKNDYFGVGIGYTSSSETYDITDLSSTYNVKDEKGNTVAVPTFVNSSSIIGGYGYNIGTGFSIFDKKSINVIKYSEANKTSNGGIYVGGLKTLEITNIDKITDNNILSLAYKTEINQSREHSLYNANLSNYFSLNLTPEKKIDSMTKEEYANFIKGFKIRGGLLSLGLTKDVIKTEEITSTETNKYNLILNGTYLFNDINKETKEVETNLGLVNGNNVYYNTYPVNETEIYGIASSFTLKIKEESAFDTLYLNQLNNTITTTTAFAFSNSFQKTVGKFFYEKLLFFEDFKTDARITNFMYRSDKNGLTYRAIDGYAIALSFPLYYENFHSRENLFWNENNDLANDKIQKNMSFISNNSYSIDKKLSLYTDYNYRENKINIKSFEQIQSEEVVNDEGNSHAITEINSNVNKNNAILTEENTTTNDIEAGLKYSFFQKTSELKDGTITVTQNVTTKSSITTTGSAVALKKEEKDTSEIDLKLVLGGGYQVTEYTALSKEAKGIYGSLGTENKIQFNMSNIVIFNLKFKPHFSDGEMYKQEYDVVTGYYLRLKNFNNIISLKYTTASFAKEEDNALNADSLVATISGDLAFDDKKRTSINYSLQYSEINPNSNKTASGNLTFKSVVFDNNDLKQQDTTNSSIVVDNKEKGKDKEKKIILINQANIFISFDINMKRTLLDNYNLYGLNSGGSIITFNNSNTFSIKGGISFKEDALGNTVEDSSLNLSDTQKITDEINIVNGITYIKNYNKLFPENETSSINISSKINVAKLVLKNLSLTADLVYSTSKVGQKSDNSLSKGGISINYTF